MDQIEVFAHAKINLSLDIVNKRPDGYHNISSVMQSIGVCDHIMIEKTAGPFVLAVDKQFLPADARNLSYKAAMAISEYAEVLPNVSIVLKKRIPVGAGLAGGSADAAGTLIGMNMLLDLNLTEGELFMLAQGIGSDVPFCLNGGTYLVEGRGEVLSEILNETKARLLLYKPPFSVSTASVYEKYDPTKVTDRPDNIRLISALKKGSIMSCFPYMKNVMESVTVMENPALEKARRVLLEAGADYVLMTGSGPTLMAFFYNDEQGQRIHFEAQKLPGEVLVTEFFPNGQEIRIP